jgi:hypothetical protein
VPKNPSHRQRLRRPEQLLRAFSYEFARCRNQDVRVLAVGPKYIHGDGYVTVPHSLVPPQIRNLHIDQGMVVIGGQGFFRGLGYATIVGSEKSDATGFVLMGPMWHAEPTIKRFLAIAAESGAVALERGLVNAVGAGYPQVLWVATVFQSLFGSDWLFPMVVDGNETAFQFHPLMASVEAWKRLIAGSSVTTSTLEVHELAPNAESQHLQSTEATVTEQIPFELSATKKLILKALIELHAVDTTHAVSCPTLAQHMKMAADTRLRGELADLRSLQLLGGAKGERGYWLTAAGLKAAQAG